MSDRENIKLLKQLHDNEEGAIKTLFSMHYRPLCYFAKSIIQNTQEAEDIAAEVFIKFLTKKSQFDNLPDIKSFLFTATRNACIDLLRKQKTLRTGLAQSGTITAIDGSAFDNEMLMARLLQTVYAEIENLPGQCKKVFKSFFLEGKNTVTIAHEMGLKQQTVLNQKIKAQKLLRSILLKKGLDYIVPVLVVAGLLD
jgi:RNA polymerase sigma factor (sigma-70 family)